MQATSAPGLARRSLPLWTSPLSRQRVRRLELRFTRTFKFISSQAASPVTATVASGKTCRSFLQPVSRLTCLTSCMEGCPRLKTALVPQHGRSVLKINNHGIPGLQRSKRRCKYVLAVWSKAFVHRCPRNMPPRPVSCLCRPFFSLDLVVEFAQTAKFGPQAIWNLCFFHGLPGFWGMWGK